MKYPLKEKGLLIYWYIDLLILGISWHPRCKLVDELEGLLTSWAWSPIFYFSVGQIGVSGAARVINEFFTFCFFSLNWGE